MFICHKPSVTKLAVALYILLWNFARIDSLVPPGHQQNFQSNFNEAILRRNFFQKVAGVSAVGWFPWAEACVGADTGVDFEAYQIIPDSSAALNPSLIQVQVR